MAKGKKIGLICSVPMECGDILSQISRKRIVRKGNAEFIAGVYEKKQVALAIAGLGKTNAAHGAGLLIEKYNPTYVINFGIGGGYPERGLLIGDIAVAQTEIYADEGLLTHTGFCGMDKIGIPLLETEKKQFFNEFSADTSLLNKFKKMRRGLPDNIEYGRFLTVSTTSGTRERGKYLRDRFDGLCENMEGAAVFHISHMYGIPCFAVRGISNIVEDRDKSTWDIEKAASNCQLALGKFLKVI